MAKPSEAKPKVGLSNRCGMADRTKLYKVPGKEGYGISEDALKRKTVEEIRKPDTSGDFSKRTGAIMADALSISPFSSDKGGHTREVNEAIARRNAAYESKLANQTDLKKALQNKEEVSDYDKLSDMQYKKGGVIKSHASKRRDGCAQRGKTKGRFV